jgi:hypothetical protein
MELHPLRVVILQILVDLQDDLRIVGPVLVQPENGGGAGRLHPFYGELHPIPDREIFRLAHPEDVPLFHLLLQQGGTGIVDGADRPVPRSLEGLVVGAVLLRLLRHESHVRDAPDGRGIERAVLPAILDDGPIRRRVTPVGNHRVRIVRFSVGTPHFPRVADDDRHRRVDDDVVRCMQVRDPLVRVDHREGRPILVYGLDIRLDFRPFRLGQFPDLHVQVAQAKVRIHTRLFQCRGMLFENILVEDGDGVAEHDRIGDLHHGRFQVQRQQHAALFRILDLLFVEFPQGADIHHRRIDHFAFLQVQLLLQDGRFPVIGHELDPYARRLFHRGGFFAAVEVPPGHMGHVGFRIAGPGAHLVRVLLREQFHRDRRPAVGVSLPQHRVHGAAENLGESFLKLPLRVVFRFLGIVRDVVAVLPQFLDRRLQLRDGSADVGQLDDVGLRLQRELAQLGQVIRDPLLLGQLFRKVRDDPSRKGDVPRLHGNAGSLGVRLDDGKKGVGRQRRCLIDFRPDDL